MKKENKKIAQQRRAEERKKEAHKSILKKVAMVCVPVLLLIGLFAIGTMDFNSKSSDSTAATGEADTSSTTNSDASYLTDESLTVKDGDTVNIDYVGYVDGEEFSGGNTQGIGTDLVIGSGSYIDDFEEQLIGSHPGDQVEVRVTFPDSYHQASLAGKDALFLTTINGIYE